MPPAILSQEDADRHPILWDTGVLGEGPVCELGDWSGGLVHAMLWKRSSALRAQTAGATLLDDAAGSPGTLFSQCVVHLQKSREATLQSICDALTLLAPDGELLAIGYNELGVRSWVKQLEGRFGCTGRVRSNRKRGRVVAFEARACKHPAPPAPGAVEIEAPITQRLLTRAGVFSAGRLDPGSCLLLAHLAAQGEPSPPDRVLDVGCGCGTLGLQALGLWPKAQALLLDHDLRAVRSTADNITRLGFQPRARVRWRDAEEAIEQGEDFDLVLINPPFHGDKHVDLGPAMAMFDRASERLSPEGAALIVANRTLPYEPVLKSLGTLETLEQARGFKLLRLTQPRR